MADSSSHLNQTMRSRQLVDNFFLDNSAQLEPDFREGNHAFSNSDYQINEKQFAMLEAEDFGGQTLTFGHGKKQLHATEKSPSNKQTAAAKESRNIR